MNKIVVRLFLCLSLATITDVAGAQIREYSAESAITDLAEGNADLILYSGISPTVYQSDEVFKEHYGIGYNEFGCIAECSDEEMKEYNSTIFSWLDENYGADWLNEVRADAVGLQEWILTHHYGDIGFVVDGVFWWLENTSRERFDSSEALDCFLKANPFINKEDIDDVVLIKREEWSAHNIYPNHPKDTFIITTKKDSAIKTFFLNGKPKKRHRGIELGCLLDNAVLKRQIKKQWGINPKRITDITVQGKDIHISTK